MSVPTGGTQGFIQGGGGGDRGVLTPPVKMQGGDIPPLFYLPIKVNCLQKSHIILEKQSEQVVGLLWLSSLASTVKKVEVYYEVDS